MSTRLGMVTLAGAAYIGPSAVRRGQVQGEELKMRAIVLGLLASLWLAGAARADDKTDIQALNDEFSAAANRGDGAAMAALYAPGATMLPPDNSVVTGAAIGPYLAGFEKSVAHLKLVTTDVVRLSPDYIREIGIASFETLGDKPTKVKGTYVVVWKRVGGAWKLWTDIFH
ncbi:MAG TPA: nuclear transport factor 2 family protein [Caulobacteraceae bacterium]|jgi:uncharacterized protein (TIGR02246 family)